MNNRPIIVSLLFYVVVFFLQNVIQKDNVYTRIKISRNVLNTSYRFYKVQIKLRHEIKNNVLFTFLI